MNLEIDDTDKYILSSLVESHIKWIESELGGDDHAKGEINSHLYALEKRLAVL